MRMSVNFVLPEFQPEITTSTVCSDGYGVQNLINFNPFRGGWKGFMAESFIKPPVDITIKFPFNICIERIVLDPCVGRQKSSGFEIYSACVLPMDQGPDNEKRESNKTAPIFTRIANTLIPWPSMSENTCILRFINNTYRASFPDIRRLSPQKQDVRGPGDIERFMRRAMPGAVDNVNCITIRITRSYGGSVLAIRRVEVWGEPSLRIPKQSQLWALEIIRKLYSGEKYVSNKKQAASGSMHDSLNSSVQRKPNLDKISSNRSRLQKAAQLSTSHSSAHEETNECPEDFLDLITCQMIMLPVLLPSGHTVDRSTLEKHNKTEAIWGRPPNDPFTGVAFTSKSQPVPNVKLKTRIDQYLLKSGNKYGLIARDVGRTSNAAVSAPSASTLVVPSTTQSSTQSCKYPKVNKHINVKSVKGKNSNLHPFNVSAFSKSSNQTKKALLASHQKRALVGSADQPIDHQPLVKKPKLYQLRIRSGNPKDLIVPSGRAESTRSTCSRTDLDSKSHEESLSDSLDSALSKALGSLPSYSDNCAASKTASTNGLSHGILQSSTATPAPSCTACHVEVNTALGDSSQPSVCLYSLPCTHLICRACLVTTADNALNNQYETRFCAGCGRTYRKEDVVRVHL